MNKQKKSILVLAVMVAFVAAGLFLPGLICAGDLDPSDGPDDPGSAMYTLEDIYNRLDTGDMGTKRPGGFVEPTLPPGSTGNTIDEVMDKMPVPDDTNGAAPEDVASGKTYWGLRTDGTWGQQTGTHECITCEGTLNGTRWCDQGDGTVKDMTTGLVWLKNASWGGIKKWRCWDSEADPWDDAHTRAGLLYAGASGAGLSDGSVVGDWRLPTKEELHGLANGTEAVRGGNPRAFTGVQSSIYWSSTTYASDTYYVWIMTMIDGSLFTNVKAVSFYVWPVRSDN